MGVMHPEEALSNRKKPEKHAEREHSIRRSSRLQEVARKPENLRALAVTRRRQPVDYRLREVSTSGCPVTEQRDQDRAMTPPQYAAKLGVSVEKVHGWIRRDELRAINVAAKLGGRP